ncbi:hypothetical protein [Nocardia exalbida]|uniref:hypothetical protein n=1 Tax=Nocardia exalbida TaxID=290231 RepID=UPI001C3F3FDA|nr:hypothetical protein [Nocardia exalbida]
MSTRPRAGCTGRVVVQAVHGLGGIGKSTLVAHWAATRPHGHRPIVWITADASTGVQQGWRSSLRGCNPC